MRRIILLNLSIIVIIGLLAIFLVNADSNVNVQSGAKTQNNNPCVASIVLQSDGIIREQCVLNANGEFDVSPSDPAVQEACITPPGSAHESGVEECNDFCADVSPLCRGEISNHFNNRYQVTCGLEVQYKEREDGGIGEVDIDNAPGQSAHCVKTFKCECVNDD